MRFLKAIFSLYSWHYPAALVYMLQNTEYEVHPYLSWYWRTVDFSKVAYRRTLQPTKAARLLLIALRMGMLLQLAIGLAFVWVWYTDGLLGGRQFGLALILAYPLVWAHLVAVPLFAGKWLLVKPRQKKLITQAEHIFRKHPGIKLAIVGSYGKTSMKELLTTVLGEGKKVAATPANKNVAISHAYFARKLSGDEDVVIIEYGEGAPGDIARFARITHPTHAIITGVAPAHMDHYKTVEKAAEDLFSISRFIASEQVYVNAQSDRARPFIQANALQTYDQHGALGWKVTDVVVGLSGTLFTLHKDKQKLKLHSGLIGHHHVGPLSLAAALGMSFGLSEAQVKEGIAKTAPFEHRMQPYTLHGAWIIDDTYNGNIDGVRAGTALLEELQAERKIYVTPGLVDQGKEAASVHQQMGQLIAGANPDIVVLMQNSATADIQTGLDRAGFSGEVIIEDKPLDFYTNLQSFVAAGDVVLLQNDWTDNYA